MGKVFHFIPPESQTTVKCATSATVRHRRRDFSLAKMAEWIALWLLFASGF